MNESGVDQLIERVKNEAVIKAEKESKDIIKQAKDQAEQIINNAKKDAQNILFKATEKINKEQATMASELSLAARDYALKISDRLRTQLFFPIIKKQIRATLTEPEFLKNILEKLIINYVKDSPANLEILVKKELKTTLAAYFAGAVFDSLDQDSNISLHSREGLEGFILVKKGDHYVWDFSVETVAQELMHLVEPNLRKYFMAQKPTRPIAKHTPEHVAV